MRLTHKECVGIASSRNAKLSRSSSRNVRARLHRGGALSAAALEQSAGVGARRSHVILNAECGGARRWTKRLVVARGEARDRRFATSRRGRGIRLDSRRRGVRNEGQRLDATEYRGDEQQEANERPDEDLHQGSYQIGARRPSGSSSGGKAVSQSKDRPLARHRIGSGASHVERRVRPLYALQRKRVLEDAVSRENAVERRTKFGIEYTRLQSGSPKSSPDPEHVGRIEGSSSTSYRPANVEDRFAARSTCPTASRSIHP